MAVVTLADLGYNDILNLSGSMVAWEQAGQTLEC
jgi:rhodanese-related sulfurtransferase